MRDLAQPDSLPAERTALENAAVDDDPSPVSSSLPDAAALPPGTNSPKKTPPFADLASPYTPVLVLSPDGFIQHLTTAARSLLQYRNDQSFDAYFFTHVHGRNLQRVMRDLAAMVKRGSERASWLLRLRTGRGRWRWYRAEALNRLNREAPAVTVRLHELHRW